MSKRRFTDREYYLKIERRVVMRDKRSRSEIETEQLNGYTTSNGFSVNLTYRAKNRSTNEFTFSNYSHVTLYKTTKHALEQSKNHLGDHGLVLILRADDLEPFNVTPEERIEWVREQCDKYRKRLLHTLGLSHDELAVICEDEMLKWGNAMKTAATGEGQPL